MKHQNIIKFLDNTLNQPTKFRTKNWVGINDDSSARHNTGSQTRFKTSILRSSLCYYSDAYIFAKGTIIITNTGTQTAQNNKQKIFKNCAPFTDCISEINNKEWDIVRKGGSTSPPTHFKIIPSLSHY